jgi:hypothetical protein
MSWHNGALPTAGGGPEIGVLTSHVFDAEGTQHVFYATNENQVIELWSRA